VRNRVFFYFVSFSPSLACAHVCLIFSYKTFIPDWKRGFNLCKYVYKNVKGVFHYFKYLIIIAYTRKKILKRTKDFDDNPS